MPHRGRLVAAGRLATLLGVVVTGVASLGHVVREPSFATFAPGRPAIQPITGFSLVLAGVAVALSSRAEPTRAAQALARVLGALALVVGALVLVEYLGDLELGIDRVLPTRLHEAGPHPGRPSPLAAFAIALLGAAAIVFDAEGPRGARPREVLALLVLFIAFVTLVGHLFGAGELYEAEPKAVQGVAIPTSVSLLLIAAGALLARPREGVMRLVTSATPAGGLLRRLGVAAIVVGPLAGLGLLAAVRAAGLRDLPLLLGLGTVAGVAFALALVGVTAARLERTHQREEAQRRRTQELLTYAPMGVFTADLEGRYADVNPAGCEMLGYQREELVSMRVVDLIRAEDEARFWALRDRQLAGSVEVGAWEMRTKAGTWLPVEVTAKVLPDGRWLGFIADVSERAALEGQVRAALAEQEFLARASVELASELDPKGLLEVAAKLGADALGSLCAVDLVEGDSMRRVALASRAPLDSAVAAALEAPSFPPDCLASEMAQATAGRIAEARGAPLREALATSPAHLEALQAAGVHSVMWAPMSARGQRLAVICLARAEAEPPFERSDLVLAEALAARVALALDNARLLEQSRFQAAMFTNLAEGVFLTRTSDLRIVFANRRIEELFGYGPGELVGQPVHVINAPGDLDPEARAAEIIAHFERHGEWHGEILNRRKDGTTIWTAASVSTYEHEEYGPVWISVHTDISERKRLEEATVRALREKEMLLKEVHHRVKNNLQVISSLFSLQRGRTDSEEARAMLDESRLRIQSIALVHEQLYRSADLAGVDLGLYLRGLVGAIRASYGAEGIEVEAHASDVVLDIEAAVPCALIVAELVSNSLKHAFPTRRGRVTVTALLDAEGAVVLEVADDGIGVPPDFDWERARSLGLRLVRDLTRQLRGQVTLERGEGTRFRITFDGARRSSQGAPPPP
ncbi:MAG: PAS domain S-box protein [Myxococcales bacterium]|nr:PAS domain S-box protein [Myxococcales bacterium]